MNLNKSLEFFDPLTVTAPIHIIGLGAIGSNLVDLFARLGLTNLHLYDFDDVTAHNIANQRYTAMDISQSKTQCMYSMCKAINAQCKPVLHSRGWEPGTRLNGHVFMAVDSIELRQQIVKENLYNPQILSMHDIRMRLQDAQYYMADWLKYTDKEQLQAGMDFTSEEAKANTPVSACGTTLSVLPTINIICSNAVSNFINYIKEGNYHRTILIDAFTFNTLAM